MGIFDRYFNSFKKEQEKELEKMLKSDVFDIRLSDVKTSKFTLNDYTKEEADYLILQDYDKKSFQAELRRSVKPQALENMYESLSGKTKEQIEEERENEIKEKVKNLEDPEKMIEELENEEGKENEKTDNAALRSQAIKSIYLTVAKEYYRLVGDLQTGKNGQIYTGSIVNGTRIDNKIILYQSYLRKLDLWYRNTNHGIPIGYDEEVNKLINSEEYEKEKNDKITNNVRDKQVDRIIELQEKMSAIEKEMVEISNLVGDNADTTEKLISLKKDYAETKLELAVLKPSIEIIHAEYEEQERIEEQLYKHGVNTKKEERIQNKVLDRSTKRIDSKNDFYESKTENITEDLVHNKLIDEKLVQSEEALNKFDIEFSKGNIEDALESLITAKELIATASETIDNSDKDTEIFDKAKQEIQNSKQEQLENERNERMGTGAVYSPAEILSNDLNASIMEIRDKVKGEIDKAKGSKDRVR